MTYRVLKTLNLVSGWPKEIAHYLDWKPGDLIVLPDVREVEGLISGGLIEPVTPKEHS